MIESIGMALQVTRTAVNNKEVRIMTAKEYWEELNKEYGLDLEMPEELSLDVSAIQYDIAMGMSFDAATQNNM